MKANYKLADLIVEANFNFPFLSKQCQAYRVADDFVPDISVTVSAADIESERNKQLDGVFSDGYCESLAFYRKLMEQAASFNCILFHGSALAVDGEGYIFGAPSGTGKSTHAGLYRKYYGDRVQMVNDDKPMIRLMHDQLMVYGTPWDGKHRLSHNIAVPLKGICFLQQGTVNQIRALTVSEAFRCSLNQIYRPEDEAVMRQVLTVTQTLVSRVPMYMLSCTISEAAVQMSLEALKGV